MALSGLDIYKLLPKTNCRECGFGTCLAFAMQLAKKAVSIDKCPYVSVEAKQALESASQPPIRPVEIGSGEKKLVLGNETVLFRHEEKFRNPCGIGFILDDTASETEYKKVLVRINSLSFERVGQQLSVNLIAVKNTGDAKRFTAAVKIISENTVFPLVLMSDNVSALQDALAVCADKRPLVYKATQENYAELVPVIKKYNVPLVVSASTVEGIAGLTQELVKSGIQDLMLDTGIKPIKDKLWDFTQFRRLALKKANRSVGYPVFVVVEQSDSFTEAHEAATYILKYASIVLLRGMENWEILSLLTLRQNIYSDPQKPLQIEPKLYPVGAVNATSPVLITTNFSLSYYTVLSEVEASKVPAYILSVDTEGMSVLTAWAAEKFTPEKIADFLNKSGTTGIVSHRNLIIPGYVAGMSGDLEEKSGWKIIVGPKEAAALPSFMKNLH